MPGNSWYVFQMQKFEKKLTRWFFNNAINGKLTQNEGIHKIFPTEDLAVLLKVDDIDSYY